MGHIVIYIMGHKIINVMVHRYIVVMGHMVIGFIEQSDIMGHSHRHHGAWNHMSWVI